MSDTYNITPAEINIHCRKGDNLDMAFEILLNNEEYSNLETGSLKMEIRDFKGTVKRTLLSTGDSPGLSALNQELTISGDGFDYYGTYKYDLQHTNDSGEVKTVMKGLWVIEDEQTE